MPQRPLLKLNEVELEAIRKTVHEGANGHCTIPWALLHLAEGKSRRQTAKEAGVHPVTVTRWVRRFRERGLAGFIQNGPYGRPVKLNSGQREALNQIARTPPRSLGKHFSRWTLQRLARHFSQQAGLAVGAQYVGQQLRRMGLLRVVPGVDHDCGFQPTPKTALIWVTVATLLHDRENPSNHRVLFVGFDLGNGTILTHWANQRRPAQFIEFLKSLGAAYPDQRMLAIMECGAIHISRSVWKYLDSEAGRLELVLQPPPPHPSTRTHSTRRLDTDRRASQVCFLFNSPEWVIESLRKKIAALKRELAKEADFSPV